MRQRRKLTSLLLLFGFSMFLACSGEEVVSTESQVVRRPNVLLISLDALGAAHLGCYGADRATTPFLDELAGEGVLFKNAFVNTHGTPPSHTTMLSGLYQETHRVAWADPGTIDVIPQGVPLLAEILKAEGYRTLGVTDGGYVGASLGFSRGFDEFDDQGGGVRSGTGKMLAMLGRHTDDSAPKFLFYHTYEVHSPYEPPAEYEELFGESDSSFEPTSENLLAHVHTASDTLSTADRERIHALYDAGLRYTDDVLREFFGELGTAGFLHDAVVIVTADHGEEIAEHGGLLHRGLLYEELIRVPLIVSAPFLPRGVVEDSMSSLVQIAPSILDWLGLPRPDGMEGDPLRIGKPIAEDDAVFGQYSSASYFIRTRKWKLIETVSPFHLELYDLDQDPGETMNLVQQNDALVRSLFHRILKWKNERKPVDGEPSPFEPTPEEIEQLESLGYLQ